MRAFVKSFVLALAGAVSLSSAAFAGENTLRVSYADLDLSRPLDAAKFDARVAAEAKAWCAENATRQVGVTRFQCQKLAVAELRRELPSQQREALQIARSRPVPVEVAALR